MTCFTCHTATHGRGGLSELRPLVERDAACVKCHPALASAAASARHSFHKAGPGSAELAHLARAIADRPDFARAREMRGGLLERLGRHEEAARERSLAIRFRH